MKSLFVRNILINSQWIENVRITFDHDGKIEKIKYDTEAKQGDKIFDTLISGIPNSHSHSFQRLMSGQAERYIKEKETLQCQQSKMYELVSKLKSEDLYNISKKLYTEMLQNGFTSVAEFHYI